MGTLVVGALTRLVISKSKWQMDFVPDAAFETRSSNEFWKGFLCCDDLLCTRLWQSSKPTLPDIVAVNWMNTWEDYCNLVGDTVGQRFNGTFNLNLKMSLVQQDGSYRLVQTPIITKLAKN